MRSVTEQAALDEFLSTAELAGTDFTAEKMNNVKIIHTDQKNPYLLSAAEERSTLKKHTARRNRLTVPRRPPWDDSTTPQELDRKERESLLEWRRGLADLQENEDLLMTPFERNIEVWRQLWRVIERSDIVVQIVDARNPLLFRSEDLEKYVKEVDGKKENLLLVNKADMMTPSQRTSWADYFERSKISYRFFSARLASEMYDSIESEEADSNGEGSDAERATLRDENNKSIISNEAQRSIAEVPEADGGEGTKYEQYHGELDDRIRILTVDELEVLFTKSLPEMNDESSTPPKVTIGLVGYPNVGKSSTINALIGAKKVSVSTTPGKTKHFQTIHLTQDVVLCDCPGLVFPNFATTKAELVCNGVLPIDQLREYTGPASLVARRIPKTFFEALYGLRVHTRPLEEGGTGIPTAEEILTAYAVARGFATTGQGQPDESRAARFILKDYVNGRLLFCHPPPKDPPINPHEFNRDLYALEHLPEKCRALLMTQVENAQFTEDNISSVEQPQPVLPKQGAKSSRLDERFFGRGQGNAGHLNMPFNYQYSEKGKKQMSGRKLKAMVALEKDMDPGEVKVANSKKHFKGGGKNKETKIEYD